MNDDLGAIGNAAKSLSKNPLGIIALFIVLIYGFAALVTAFSGSFSLGERIPLVYFLVFFPVLVLGVFLWLVMFHSSKLYGPTDFKNEENYMRIQLTAATALGAASSKVFSEDNPKADFAKIANTVIDASPNQGLKKYLNRKLLWVDDRPENNVFVRRAFEALGLKISLALSTDDALEMIKNNEYAVIISDMGRKEGPREGYVLLDILRMNGNKTPFFIYAGSNLPEHKKEAEKHGAQGSTNDSQELFHSVTRTILDSPISIPV